MIARFFHNWERRLAAAATDRTERPFEWGFDWLGQQDGNGDESACLPPVTKTIDVTTP